MDNKRLKELAGIPKGEDEEQVEMSVEDFRNLVGLVVKDIIGDEAYSKMKKDKGKPMSPEMERIVRDLKNSGRLYNK
jgi:hypothetical protein